MEVLELDDKKFELAYQLFCDACAADEAGNIRKAIRLHTKAANLGYSGSSSNLGVIYSYLVPPQMKKSVYWCKRAVRQGDRSGAWNLSVHYRMMKNERWRLHWLRRAAEMGEEDAIAELRKHNRKSSRRK